MAADDLVKSGDGASATGVFGTMPKEQEPEPARKPESARVEPITAMSASSGGFTQLLRALNCDAVKEAPAGAATAAPVASKAPAPAADGPMTQLLRTITATEASAIEKPQVPPGSAQVTSFLPQSAPVSSVAAAVAPAAPAREVGLFTELLQKPEAWPAQSETKKGRAEAPSITAVPAAPKVIAAPDEHAEPVSFTQLFVGIGADAGHKNEAAPIAAQVKAPGSFTQAFEILDNPAVSPAARVAEPMTPNMPTVQQEAPRVVSASTPGSFTQMFQTLNAHEIEQVPVTPPVARVEMAAVAVTPPVVKVPETSAALPGSFTQIFQALDAPTVEQVRYESAPLRAGPSEGIAPGSFTQMFKTLGEEPKPQEHAAGPGSFTQLFGGGGSLSAPFVPPAPSSYNRTFAANGPGEESGASQMFATYREPETAPLERGPRFSLEEAAPVVGAPASTPSSGGLTQLLRALDGPTPATRPYAAPGYSPPVAPASQPGSFTGVYDELGTPATAVPARIAPVMAPEPVAGPSEFTRLINASALREAGLRGGGGPAGAPHAGTAVPASSAPGFALPSGFSAAVPHASFAAPAAPHASITGPAGAHAGVSAAGGGHASLAAPHLPGISAAPKVKLPDMSKAAGTPAGIQKYVPLLLILVIFLLLAILVAVVVLMKR